MPEAVALRGHPAPRARQRRSRHELVAGTPFPGFPASLARTAHPVMRGPSICIAQARARAAPWSPKPTAEGSTPSGPANAPGIQPGHQHLDNRIGTSLVGAGATPAPTMGRSRHGAQLSVEQPSIDTGGSIPSRPTQGASLLTGREPGSYPGRDRVRGLGRARCPCRRSSARGSAGPSSRRSGVRVPSVALAALQSVSTWPNGEGAGLRSRRLQVRPLPSTLGSFTCRPKGRPDSP